MHYGCLDSPVHTPLGVKDEPEVRHGDLGAHQTEKDIRVTLLHLDGLFETRRKAPRTGSAVIAYAPERHFRYAAGAARRTFWDARSGTPGARRSAPRALVLDVSVDSERVGRVPAVIDDRPRLRRRSVPCRRRLPPARRSAPPRQVGSIRPCRRPIPGFRTGPRTCRVRRARP